MNEIFGLILKYKFGAKYRTILFVSTFVLVVFHVLVLVSPFLDVFTEGQVQHLQDFSDSISNISVAIILMLLLVEGQRSIRSVIIAQRRQNYKDIGDQIAKWFSLTGSPTFEPWVVDSETTEEREILRNFKVIGNYKKLCQYCRCPEKFNNLIKDYCDKVHFEFTSYPCEIIYGIHFEFYNRELNETLAARVRDELALGKQSVEIKADNIIPKKPNWIFLTRTVELVGDVDSDFATVLTHGRHFVELVGHYYDIIYSEQTMDIYLHLMEKSDREKNLSSGEIRREIRQN